MTQAPTLADFGHGAMVQNGRPALGQRPCMIVLAEYDGFPPFSDFHQADYYEKLGFGTPIPPFTTGGPVNPVNPASLREYFGENSHGRFWFDRVAVVGPIALGAYDPNLGAKPEVRSATILDRVTDQLFGGLDVNDDNVISVDELCVVIFENLTGLQPANRDNNPVIVRPDSPISLLWPFPDKTIAVHVAMAGPVTPFYLIAHELSHSLGTRDLYGTGNTLLTLMGDYPFEANGQVTVHLDAWHKLQLGWIEPRRFDLAVAGSELVHTGPDGAVLLWGAERLAGEYFLVERRGPHAPGRSYDSGVAGDGVLIWRVGNGMAHLGAPSLIYGGSGVWGAGKQTPLLRWSDGASTGTSILISDAGNGALRIDWVPWGVELTLSEPVVIDVEGTATSERTDACGNVLRFGTWYTTTTITFTASEMVGFSSATTSWKVEGHPLAPGGTSGDPVDVDYQISPDGLSLTLTSRPSDFYQLTVGFHASDAMGHSANVEYFFSVEAGSYSGLRWEDIAPASQCIADNIPIPVDVDGFTMPWEEEPGVDFRPVPLEWPGWMVEEWGEGALKRLQADRSLDAASREAIGHYIDLQMNSPKFRLAARDLALRRRVG